MATEDPVHRAISEEELRATAESSRTFSGILFPATLALDEFDFTESRFERCRFAVPTIRRADFAGSAFRNCTFEPTRFSNCTLADARFDGCALFDVQQKKGCTFAFATCRRQRPSNATLRRVHSSAAICTTSGRSNAVSRRTVSPLDLHESPLQTVGVHQGRLRQMQLQLRGSVGVVPAELRVPVLQIFGGVLHRHRLEPCHDAGLRPGSGRVGPGQAAPGGPSRIRDFGV